MPESTLEKKSVSLRNSSQKKKRPHVEFRSDWTPLLWINGHRLGFLVIP